MKKLFAILLITACSTPHNEELYADSAEIHKVATKTGAEVGQKIKRMNSFLGALEESALKDSISTLKQDFIDWEKSIVEVPGLESDNHDHHDHNHSHDHDHAPPPDLTPEMMLDVQKSMRDQIDELNIRAENLLRTL
ncbi:MAG: hypothetical protein AAF391_03265 [Bacteroidota bacterium]